ncbi:MAG: hypothetical protein A2Z18_01415 [Armatimonadetes bacterium RBG_16_58_9]|nr:MAG: hypothetical protein A2Z18_01415 [Armatimonadetes bacterium RBG_16_58_9]
MSKQLWTPEKVLDRIRDLHKAGHDLSRGNASKIAPRLVAAAERLLGGWGRAVQEAGMDYIAIAEAARRRALARRAIWSKERVVECIRKAAERKEPLQAAVASRMHPDLYGAACSRRYFGGWANALKAAGIQIQRDKPGKPGEYKASLTEWKVDLLLERISQLAEQKYSIDEHNVQALAPTLYKALIRRFGSWAEALRAAHITTRPRSKRLRRIRNA